MVLQDKYAKAASRRYARTHATELTDEDAALKAAVEQAEKRRLGSNADRYREDDERLARESGEVGAGPVVPEEVDEEEAAEQAELDEFRLRQRDQLLQRPPEASQDEEDDEDVDHSFAHLRIGGAKGKRVAKSPGAGEVDEELQARQDEARRTQAVRDLKDRFSGSARPLPSPSSSSSSRPFTLPPKPGVKSTGKGQDFLDTLL
ncbi:hypothetical protein JCM6882_006677 [Rhodosporidiobolus microsporus]